MGRIVPPNVTVFEGFSGFGLCDAIRIPGWTHYLPSRCAIRPNIRIQGFASFSYFGTLSYSQALDWKASLIRSKMGITQRQVDESIIKHFL